jgi:protein SCO1/2
MTKKLLFYGLFFVLLFIGFVFALNKLIPGFSEVKMPVLSNVQPFSFTNQDGKQITERDITGKVCVVEYFFTTCKGICPKMNRNMKTIYEKFKGENNFLILSHTVDPETDNVGRMKLYADSLGADSNKWLFLTGRKDSLYSAARLSYLLDDPKNNNGKMEEQFIHTQFFALVDKSGSVRKIYDGLKQDELHELMEDIDKLLVERTEKRSVNSLFNNNPQ